MAAPQPTASAPPWDIPPAAARAALAAILLLALLNDLFFFTGHYASDDMEYLSAARQIVTQGSLPEEPTLGQNRLLMVGWNAAVAWAAGYDADRIAATHVCFHLLTIALVALLARRWFDRATAVLTAWAVALFPALVLAGTAILPDTPLACCLLGAVLAIDEASRRHAKDASRTALALLVACGALVGLGYLAKETSLILGPFFAAAWLCIARRRGIAGVAAGWMALLLGFVIVFAGEWIALSALTGRAYTRAAWVVDESIVSPTRTWPYGFWPHERLWHLWYNLGPPYWSPRDRVLGLASAAAYAALVRGRPLPLLLVGWYFAYHTFGSMSLSAYVPPSLQARYFTPVVPLILLMGSAALVTALRGAAARSRVGRPIAVAAIAGVAVYWVLEQRQTNRGAGKLYRADIVRTAQSAIHAARDVPLALSSTIARHLTAIYVDGLPDRVMASSRVSPQRLRELLNKGGLDYAEIAPWDRLESIQKPSAMDRALHGPLRDWLATSPSDDAAASIRVDLLGEPVQIARVERHACPRTRADEWAQWLGGPPPPTSPNTREVRVFRITRAP